jgi:hypothetical protein
MDALLRVTRQISKLDPNRVLANIHHIATGGPRASSAWKSLVYDLQELENVFRDLAHAGHDIRAAYRDFDDLRRWVYAAASPVSHSTPHSSPKHSQRSPVTTSTRPEHARARVSPAIPTSPKHHHHSSRGHVIAPTPVRGSPPPKARSHVRFAATATVYTVSRYLDAPRPPPERPSCVPRAPRQSHAK